MELHLTYTQFKLNYVCLAVFNSCCCMVSLLVLNIPSTGVSTRSGILLLSASPYLPVLSCAAAKPAVAVTPTAVIFVPTVARVSAVPAIPTAVYVFSAAGVSNVSKVLLMLASLMLLVPVAILLLLCRYCSWHPCCCLCSCCCGRLCGCLQLGSCLHCNENPIYVFLFGELRGPQSQFTHVCVC
jgi:hypothetical protein